MARASQEVAPPGRLSRRSRMEPPAARFPEAELAPTAASLRGWPGAPPRNLAGVQFSGRSPARHPECESGATGVDHFPEDRLPKLTHASPYAHILCSYISCQHNSLAIRRGVR